MLTLLPAPLVNAHRCIPISFINNPFTLAMTDPTNIVAFDDVRRILTGVMIEPAAVSEEDLKRFVSTLAEGQTSIEEVTSVLSMQD